MNDAPAPSGRDRAEPLGATRATLLAMFALLAVNVVAVAASSEAAPHVRLMHYLYEAGHVLALGLVAALGVALWERLGVALWGRLGPRWQRPVGYAVLGALALALAVPTLGEDLLGFAEDQAGTWWRALLYAVLVGFAGVIVATAWIGQRLARPRWRWIGVAGGVAGLVLNHLVLRDDYPAAHLFLALAGAVGIAASLTTAPVPRWWDRARARLPLAVGFLVAAISVLIRPDNRVMLAMLQHSGSIVAPYQARLAFGGDAGVGVVPKRWEPWFAPRTDVEPVPPTSKPWRPDTRIVLLVTIDSLRADLLTKRKHQKSLPNLARLRKESIIFTEARAPGSQTVYTLAQMFAGRYFSQMYWTKQEGIRDLWPHEDEQVRFPELLQQAGVKTMTAAGTYWLVGEQGIVRGFDVEEYEKPKGTRYQVSKWQIPTLIEHLDTLGPQEQFFGFVHLLDAHYTVSPVKRKGAFRKYLANLKLVDEQLGALREYLESSPLGEHTLLVVSSDHGEAFGEHGTKRHRVSLYEELIRVPLWLWAPDIRHREIDTPVTLMDVGPTILDVFGQPTPGSYMGQSLVPLARGDKKAAKRLTRPILAEGRMKKALLFEDGFKAIVDDRNYTMELYNLEADPKELDNLIQDDTSPGMSRIGVLRQFFDKAQIRRKGYKIPYRP